MYLPVSSKRLAEVGIFWMVGLVVEMSTWVTFSDIYVDVLKVLRGDNVSGVFRLWLVEVFRIER